MDISTIKTIVCIVPTENLEGRNYVSQSFIPHVVTQRRLDQQYQLEMTVNGETSSWNVDRVTVDLGDEVTKLIDSALSGYDAACLSLSVSDEYKGTVTEQRKANLKSTLNILKTRIETSQEHINIEYAYIGIQDHACYDIRKGISRSNVSMIRRGMDSIMQAVQSVDDISAIIEDVPTLPFILNIKLANTSKNTLGRLTLVDLLHPRFTPLLPGITNPIHESFDYLRYIVEKHTTPNCKEQFKTSSTVLTNEITKCFCGNCKCIVVGYINDKIVSEIHSKETSALLSFVSSFKNIPVHALPNSTLQETSEYKLLSADLKKKKSLTDTLLLSNSKLKDSLSQKDITISRLETNLNYVRTEFTEKYDNLMARKEKKALLNIHEKQIEYLKASITSKASLYEYDKLELNADIVRLKSMLDIKEFAEEDMMLEMQSKKRRYEEAYLSLKRKVEDCEEQEHELRRSQKILHGKLHDMKMQKAQKRKPTAPPPKQSKVKDESPFPEPPEGIDVNMDHPNNSQINEERRRELEELKSTYEKLQETLKEREKENEEFKKNAVEDFERGKAMLKRRMETLKKDTKKEIFGIKEMANQKMSALNRKYQDKLAEQEREIEEYKEELLSLGRRGKKAKFKTNANKKGRK